jgi:hypothetical protein
VTRDEAQRSTGTRPVLFHFEGSAVVAGA